MLAIVSETHRLQNVCEITTNSFGFDLRVGEKAPHWCSCNQCYTEAQNAFTSSRLLSCVCTRLQTFPPVHIISVDMKQNPPFFGQKLQATWIGSRFVKKVRVEVVEYAENLGKFKWKSSMLTCESWWFCFMLDCLHNQLVSLSQLIGMIYLYNLEWWWINLSLYLLSWIAGRLYRLLWKSGGAWTFVYSW